MTPEILALVYCAFIHFNRKRFRWRDGITFAEFRSDNKEQLEAIASMMSARWGIDVENQILALNSGICLFMYGEGLIPIEKIRKPYTKGNMSY